jgi:hypothetical protein
MAQAFHFGYFVQVGPRIYAGASARTCKGTVVYSCPCGERFAAEVWHAVDSSSPDVVERLHDGTLNRALCPSCGLASDVQLPVLYHDLGAPSLTLLLPESLRHRELAERARLFETLAADAEPPPPYVLSPEVRFGLRAATVAVSTLMHPPLGDTDQHPVATPDVVTRLRINVPDPRQTVTERWIASREGPSVFLVEDAVLACAALPADSLEHFIGGPIELRVQLHRLPSYPVVTLTFIAGRSESSTETIVGEQLLFVPLDVARAAHRVVLEALGQKTKLTLELYDPDYLPVVAHEISAPVEENVRRIISEAKDALDRLAPATRAFERGRAQLMAPKYDRLGHTALDLPGELDTLEMPSAVRAALAAVARWSEPSGEAYLVEIRGLPLSVWRTTRARIIRRALDSGIAVPRSLVERSAREHVAPLPSWQELLAIGVRRFAEVAARQRPSDLTAAEEAENWEALLRECALAGVVIDDTVRSLAQAALKRARAANQGAGVDLRSLDEDELVALLERKELRREAALILCERRNPALLPLVFAAIRRMARAEANVVLPAVIGFGAPAEKWLIEGLAAKKAYLRQGCALALGALKTPAGIEALIRLLLDEPTEIWSEVARAVGDAGSLAVLPLVAQLRDANEEARDRIVRALAQIACRPENQERSPVEMLAEGRDPLAATAAQSAIVLAEAVQRDDQKVRRGAGGDRDSSDDGDQTVVRGFSRRFYEAMSGPIELSAADLEEIPEDATGDASEDASEDASGNASGDDAGGDDSLTATDLPILEPPRSSRSSLPRDRG